MTAATATGLAIVGCGNIAARYTTCIDERDDLRLVVAHDLLTERAEELAAAHGMRVAASLDAVLADDEVEVVVNLTIHGAHFDVTRQCLEAGKHVFSEKPLAMTAAEGRELASIAREHGVRLGCAPFSWMGEAAQTAWKLVREGRLGEVRVAHAEMNWGRIEVWHPNPAPFYDVGPLFDVGIYPLTTLTTIFGPVRTVTAVTRSLLPERRTLDGVAFTPGAPELYIAVLDFECGLVARLSCNFYVGHHNRQKGIELHGDRASLHVDDAVAVADFETPYQPHPLVREPQRDATDWSLGVADMASAIRDGRPHRASGEQAAHVIDVIEAIHRSGDGEGAVTIDSSFPRPQPLEWAT